MAKRMSYLWNFMPLALALAATACLRNAALAVNPVAGFLVNLLIAFSIALGMRTGTPRKALIYAVAIPLFAWLIDVTDGAPAISQGVGYAAMALTWLITPRLHGILRAGLAACAAAAALTLATAVVLFLGRETTFGAALVFAATRQIWPMIAFFLGGLLRSIRR